MMIRALAGQGVVCALLIALTFQITAPVISKNKAEALQRAVVSVLTDAQTLQTFKLNEAGVFQSVAETNATAGSVYAGYNAQGRLLGIAITAQGMGYQDRIELLYGYAPDRAAVVGMYILADRETPGLGSKIATDNAFLSSFEHLSVQLSAGNNKIIEAWQIDSISGATISSQAVVKILRQSAAFWIPKIVQQLEQFERHETTTR